MVQLEHAEARVDDCPCGKGAVHYHLVDTDNGYGSGSQWYTLECGECQRAWRIAGSVLINIERERAVERLQVELKRLDPAAKAAKECQKNIDKAEKRIIRKRIPLLGEAK